MGIAHWAKRKRFIAALIFSGLVVIPYSCSRVLSPWRRIRTQTNPSARSPVRSPDGFRILTYNIAHGRGLSESNWDGGAARDRLRNLDEIADLLRGIDADVVVLNEVDFDSSWSHGVNQAKYLADKTGYGYCVEQRNLDFRLLVWKWKFGNAMLSKYPVRSAKVVDMPGFSKWETVLFGKKRGVSCDIATGSGIVRIVGVHLSHRSEYIRARSAATLTGMAGESDIPIIVAGDTNSTPPGFPHSTNDHRGINAMAVFDDSECFRRLSIKSPPNHQFTYPSTDPQAIIDWILIPPSWSFATYQAASSQLSDHCPVFADLRFPGLERIPIITD